MTSSENQIDILLNYKSNFDTMAKDIESRIESLSSTINQQQTRFTEIAKSRTKAHNEERRLIKSNVVELQKQLKFSEQVVKSQNFGVITQRNALDTIISKHKEHNRVVSEGIKQQFIERFAQEDKIAKQKEELTNKVSSMTSKLSQFQNKNAEQEIATARATSKVHVAIVEQEAKAKNKAKLDEESKFNKESNAFKQFGANFNKQLLNEELIQHTNNIKAKSQASAKALLDESNAKRAYSKTFGGALTEGTTFGHKIATTAQYMVAGTAIYGVASAITAMASASLEADLNMRTMSAVLKISKSDATVLDDSVRKLGETYGGTTGEIEQVAIALGRAGVKTKEITDATKVVLAMARLTGDTFEQSASAVISYQQVFGDTKNITELGNKLAYIANVSRLSTQDIGTFSNYALAAAKDVGLTEDAVGGLAAAFSNAGVNASTIGTQIRRFTALLTENSTDVDNFFRGIGVNQANLLADLQKGGAASNTAMIDFVNTLSKVDKSKFTNLVGQMDILAGNSLKLMRNNSENITKYVKDLQTGVGDQLENTRIILESYKVTFESIWNQILNQGSKALQSESMNFAKSSFSAGLAILTGDMEQAKKISLAFNKDTADASMQQAEADFNSGKMASEKYLAMKAEYLQKVASLEKQTKDLVTKDIKKSTADQMISIDNLLRESLYTMNTGAADGTKLVGEAAKNQQALIDNLVAQKVELYSATVKQKTADSDSIVTNATLNLGLEKQLANITAMRNAKLNTSVEEKMFAESANAELKKNNDEINKQVESLGKYADAKKRVQDIVEGSNGDVSDLNVRVLKRLNEIKNTTITPSNKDELTYEVNVLNKAKSINEANVKIMTEKNTLIGKNIQDEESAQRKAEIAADRQQKINDATIDAQAKIKEYSTQLQVSEEVTLSKAESRLRVDASLLSISYDRYAAAKGTADESERFKEYQESEAKYLQTSVVYVTEIAKQEEKRASLKIELDSSLEQSIESEQVRLGIIEKATDSEYEKLRVKIEQGKIDGLLYGEELARQEARLAQLDTLQRKKKDVNTLAMEYQRELADQETAGYIAAKAGLSALEDGMMNFFDVTSEGWLDWHALVTDVLHSIYKQLLQELVIKQMVSGIAGGISSAFGASATPTGGSYQGVTSSVIVPDAAPTFSAFPGVYAMGGMIPTKGYANGGVLSGGTGIRDDIYLGNVSGTQVFAMGGEFITRKDAVNDSTKGTLDYINKTGQVPSGSGVNVPVSINIENQTGQAISADMISQMTKTNDSGDYEKVVNIVLKASQVDPRMRNLMKGGR